MENKTNQFFTDKDKKYYLQTFKRFPLVLDHGEGARVWDIEGKEYIDAFAGIAVTSLGHNHPAVNHAITEQISKLIHISNFFISEPQVLLSEKLTAITGMDRVFFTNSGAESVEGALKIARKYAHANGRGGEIISMTGSFHGRTLATIATGKKKMQKGFDPIPHGFHQVPLNDIEALGNQITGKTAAVILEPIQGEGGIQMADKQYLKKVRELCTQKNVVLIFDEVQCGMGRTGHWFAKDYYRVSPDIMTIAKALGNGVPIGAFLTIEKINDAIDFGDHGTTFGGNPLACSASLATLNTIEEENLLEQVREKGQWLKKQLEDLRKQFPGIVEVRGLGLMLGVEFDKPVKPLVEEMMKRGILVNVTVENVLRLVPPFIISYDELKKVIRVLTEILNQKYS